MPESVDLRWDENNVNHLRDSYRVEVDEVVEALVGVDGEAARYAKFRSGDNYVFLGMTVDGRLLAMVGEYLDDGGLYIFAARNMTGREKRCFRRK